MDKLRLSPDLFEEGFAGGCAERGIAGGGTATSTGDTSVQLEDLLVNPSVMRHNTNSGRNSKDK